MMAILLRLFAVMIFFSLVMVPPAVALNLGDIVTKVGGGVGDGGPGTAAFVNNPTGVAADSQGNVYFADKNNNRVRKIAPGTGIVTTVAGTGSPAFSGDNGAASSACLDQPTGVAVDSAGNLFIADTSNHRIRMVSAATGVITTVAGNGTGAFAGDNGAALSASLRYPTGVAVDGSGNLYIADYWNNRIRKVTAATGLIATVAGNGTATFAGDNGAATSASLSSPAGVAVSADGNVFIADTNNCRIRKVSAASGIITTIAGSGSLGYSGDGGPATAAALYYPTGVAMDGSGNIYIADQANNRIRKINGSTGIISMVAGASIYGGYSGDNGTATSALLNAPYGIGVDAAGNLFIADTSNSRIRKVAAATRIITTVAGTGTWSGFAGDNGPATKATLSYPEGMAIDSVGNLYFADRANNRIRKVSAVTGIITTVAGNGTAAFSGDNDVAVSATLNTPYGMAIDSSDNIYFVDRLNHRIRKIAAGTGIITTVAGNGIGAFAGDNGPATSASINYPLGMAVDAADNLYIADTFNNRIRKVAAATGIITTVAGRTSSTGFDGDNGLATAANLGGPNSVALDAAGNLYIGEGSNNRVRKVTAATGIITTVAGNGATTFSGDNGAATAAGLNSPSGVAVSGAGDLYIADTSHNRVRKVSAATGIITTAVGGNPFYTFSGDNAPATSAALNAPVGLALDRAGNLYIVDQGNQRIRKVYLNPVATTTTVSSSAATAVAGGSVTFSATVSSGDATPVGTTTFFDGSTTLGSASLDGTGTARWETSTLSLGEHSITAAYSAAGIHAASSSAALTQTIQAPESYTLTIPFSGSGAGTVNVAAVPSGSQCHSSCSGQFAVGASITLTAAADNGSYFVGWSGCDAVAGGICSVGLTSNKTVTASFEFDWPIYLGELRVGFNGTLQQAYDSLVTGPGLLWLRGGNADGDLICDRDVQLVLQGGWQPGDNAVSGNTEMSGALKVKAGTVTLGGILLK